MFAAPPPAADLSGRRVSVVHLGCPKNLVDSEHMLATLAGAGAELTGDSETADVVVLNTCAFIDAAKAESIDRILEAERWKGQRDGRRVVVAGCLAERHGNELRREVPAIDAVVGTGSVLDIATAVAGGNVTAPSLERLPDWLPNAATPRILTTATHTAYLKISEGCDHICTFCIIPKLRGKHRSRTIADVVSEARSLVEMGVKELNLVAQDSTSYGEDLGLHDGTAALLHALAPIPGLEWIRVHYTYPTRLSDGFLDAMAAHPNVCKYLDIPLQHANRDVLRAMKRGGDAASYLRLVSRVRAKMPEISIRTTFIVGFPNETERRFEELVGFVREAELDRVGAFTYSHEEGTTAHALRDRVPAREKEERKAHLMRVQARISARKNRARVGSRVRVLIDGVEPDRQRAHARLEGQAPEIDGSVIVDRCDGDPGDFVDVAIVGANAHDLRAVASP